MVTFRETRCKMINGSRWQLKPIILAVHITIMIVSFYGTISHVHFFNGTIIIYGKYLRILIYGSIIIFSWGTWCIQTFSGYTPALPTCHRSPLRSKACRVESYGTPGLILSAQRIVRTPTSKISKSAGCNPYSQIKITNSDSKYSVLSSIGWFSKASWSVTKTQRSAVSTHHRNCHYNQLIIIRSHLRAIMIAIIVAAKGPVLLRCLASWRN